MHRECAKSIEDTSNMAQQQKQSINQQYSSSTDEGCDTDHGGKKSNVVREHHLPKPQVAVPNLPWVENLAKDSNHLKN